MKYIISENKIDKIIFKYLDNNLKGLERKNAKYYDGFVFTFPDKEYGILGYENNGTLYVYYELIGEISNGFGLEDFDSESIIGRWVGDRLQLEVINTQGRSIAKYFAASDRLQLEVINTRILGSGKRYLANDRLN
jgi:hypothetical protein